MKAKKVITGAVAALSLLALAATGAFAAVAPVVCESGNVTAAGAGFIYVSGTIKTNLRSVTLTCDAYPVGTWTAADGERTFVIPATPDKDGVYAAALTALADGNKVKFALSTADEPATGSANAGKGLVRVLQVLANSL